MKESILKNKSEYFAASKKDFVSKMKISEKELAETIYWLGRLKNGEFITQKQYESIHADAMEIHRILSQTIRTTKYNLQQ